ncbi:Chromobox protein 3 [Geranomyces variabilis]|nr:Chromobox protein 3 [Geranomyces variabilis]
MATARDYIDDPISSGEEDAVPGQFPSKSTIDTDVVSNGDIAAGPTDQPPAGVEPMMVDDVDEESNEQAAEDDKENNGGDEDENENESEGPEWEVEAIVGARKIRGVQQYYIKWKGFDEGDNTWEPESHIHCPDLVDAYWAEQAEKQSAKAAAKNSTRGKRTVLGGSDRQKRKSVDLEQVFNIESEEDENDVEFGESASGRRPGKRRRGDSPPARRVVRRNRNSGGGFEAQSSMSPRSRRPVKHVNYKLADPEKDLDSDSGESVGADNELRGSFSSWDPLVQEIENVDEGERKGELRVYIRWKNGTRSEESALIANKKCPQAIIKFYESHIRFKLPDDGDDDASTDYVDGDTATNRAYPVEDTTTPASEGVHVEDLTDGTTLLVTTENETTSEMRIEMSADGTVLSRNTTTSTTTKGVSSPPRANTLVVNTREEENEELDCVPQTQTQNASEEIRVIPTTL